MENKTKAPRDKKSTFYIFLGIGMSLQSIVLYMILDLNVTSQWMWLLVIVADLLFIVGAYNYGRLEGRDEMFKDMSKSHVDNISEIPHV